MAWHAASPAGCPADCPACPAVYHVIVLTVVLMFDPLLVLLVVLLYMGDWGASDGEGTGNVSRMTLLIIPVISLIGSTPWLWRTFKCHLSAMGIRRHMRVGKRETGSLRKILQQFPSKELANQPLPRYDRTDDR